MKPRKASKAITRPLKYFKTSTETKSLFQWSNQRNGGVLKIKIWRTKYTAQIKKQVEEGKHTLYHSEGVSEVVCLAV